MIFEKQYNDDVLIAAYLKYGTQSKAAVEIGCSRETVARAVRRAGIPMTGRKLNGNKGVKKGYNGGGSPLKATNSELICASKTMTANEIAEKFCMHPATVRRRLKRMGISPKKPEKHENLCEPQNHRTWGEWCKERKILAEQRKKTREVEKYWFNAIHTVERKCTVCGKIFYCLDSETRVTCSHECSCEHGKAKRRERDRQRKRIRKHICKTTYRARCRKYGVYYDSSVTRDAVIKRDNGTCQICGKKCNPNDKSWGTSGPNYPTLDHIIPLAKGGAHVWANVQCACGLCNSYKRDLLKYATEGVTM
jgi:5-methylcytosine-specific restriction endonuclease McrA